MRTAPPRPRNNAFGQGSRLVRRAGYLRLLLELPADLLTKLFARAKLVRLAAGKILFRAGAPGDGCYKNRPLASPRQLPHESAHPALTLPLCACWTFHYLHSGSGAPLFKREETRLAAVKAGVLKMTLVGLVDRTMVSIAIVRQNEKCRCGQKSGSWCRDDGVEAHHWLRISSITRATEIKKTLCMGEQDPRRHGRWIVQFVGREIRILDYIEGVGQEISYYIAELRKRKYDQARSLVLFLARLFQHEWSVTTEGQAATSNG